jgi:hypothetical protein
MVIKDDPVTLAAYARKHSKHSLLNEPGWKNLKKIARRLVHDNQGVYHLHYNVMENKQTKGPVYQFGIKVPRNVSDAYELDKKNGNTKCTPCSTFMGESVGRGLNCILYFVNRALILLRKSNRQGELFKYV